MSGRGPVRYRPARAARSAGGVGRRTAPLYQSVRLLGVSARPWERYRGGRRAVPVRHRTIGTMAGIGGPAHVTVPVAPLAAELPGWVTLVRARNPGPMTLDGTNTWLLSAADGTGAIVVDPGPADEAHLSSVARQGPVTAIIVTHGHHDHVEGVARLAELTGAPVVSDGVRLDWLEIERIPTPGHTADSVSYLVARGDERLILTGDTILGRGTTVVAWPDGDLADYLDSLDRLERVGPVPVLPGHGPALADCAAAARYYAAHRRARLDQVRRAMVAGADTPRAIVEVVYADIDPALRGYAEWSARAQVAYLRRESQRGDDRLDRP